MTDSSPSAAGPAAEVLIVDNDQSHAETVAESLNRAGFRCRVATSGSEGARLVEEREFDVNTGMDKLMDRLEQKISKEKEKVQERK